MKLRCTMFSSLLVLTVVMFISSCSTTVDFAKRRYNSGFYVDISSNKQNTDKKIVQVKPAESTPVAVKVESTSEAIKSPVNADQVNKEVKNENTFSYMPVNKKEKTSKVISSKPIAMAGTIMKESKVLVKTNSSGPQATTNLFESSKYLLIWLICLGASLVFVAIGVWFLAYLAWIAFLVFFILWLIALAS